MKPSKEIDNLITIHKDWRSETLSTLREIILSANPNIVEEWKYKGSPAWSLNGVICIGNIFKDKVQLVFGNGAEVDDPDNLFDKELGGKKWRYINFFQNDVIKKPQLLTLIKRVIEYNQKNK